MLRLIHILWPSRSNTKEIQTTISVRPHILPSNKVTALVLKETKIQTEISVKPDEDDRHVYSPLEYTPYQDIQTDCVRAYNLPRKLRLHFSSSFNLNVKPCLWDDDGVNELCIDLKNRTHSRIKPGSVKYANKSTQTTKSH